MDRPTAILLLIAILLIALIYVVLGMVQKKVVDK
jgi:hypothetical protein|tara:strand:+ start:1653 stop:1754 length:102 start_codon:yes stop_codon:yes gene_type:complete